MQLFLVDVVRESTTDFPGSNPQLHLSTFHLEQMFSFHPHLNSLQISPAMLDMGSRIFPNTDISLFQILAIIDLNAINRVYKFSFLAAHISLIIYLNLPASSMILAPPFRERNQNVICEK